MIAGFFLAIRCFFCALLGKPVPEAACKRLPASSRGRSSDTAGATSDPMRDRYTEGAVQLLSLLQKEGRFIDFLQEEIDGYDDAQIGAAVRNIHRDCRRVLAEYIALQPVLSGDEDSPITVEAGFDAAQIRLIGNVTGRPPFNGVLRHHGWQATAVNLPQVQTESAHRVVAPAEVELA